MKLSTIGHSNHSIENFVALLKKHNITAIADVRSYPYSRYLPHFNQVELKKKLREAKIAYVFLGKELGARSSNLGCYVEGKALYEKIASTKEFSLGLDRLLSGVKKYNIALMCAEQDPITCHRAILICPHLKDKGLEIQHILKNGSLESHSHLEKRLLRLHKLENTNLENTNQNKNGVIQLSLFTGTDIYANNSSKNQDSYNTLTNKKLLEKAYKLQGNQIAYVDKNWQNKANEKVY